MYDKLRIEEVTQVVELVCRMNIGLKFMPALPLFEVPKVRLDKAFYSTDDRERALDKVE